ncbi:MAG: NAD(P)-dependent oxidoreductase [Pleurocapsa sp. MO_226.B13]|nr:NAD(P)-dependent oxidoreductase [Pleurocapsa sp. MO_226.B13]
MNKLLVTGASGFLGWNLCQSALNTWEVYGTYFSHEIKLPGVNLFKTDLRDDRAIAEIFQAIQPDAVIHTAAASKPNFCQTHPEESYSINVTASINIARLCGEYNIPCAFTSTDLVFDGKNPFYTESDPVSPICYYGEQKVTAEEKMSEIYRAIAICRMPLMFGLASPVSSSFLQGTIDALQTGKEINLFVDEFRTPASATAASQGLLLAIEQKVRGILHLGGKERISRYDFGLLLADKLQLPPELIKSVKQADVVMVAPRSPDTSLDSSKAFALGYQPLSLNEELTNLLLNY